MNIIVIGGGKVGMKLVEDLNGEGHNVVLVDIKESITDRVQDEFDVMGIHGSGTDVSVMEEAGVKNAELVIAVTEKDEFNVLCGIIAKKLGAKKCVARVRNREYFAQMTFMRDELGLNLIVNPEFYAANEISRMICFPAAIKTETFAKGRLELAEFRVPDDLDGKPISEIYQTYKVKVLICAVQRDGDVEIPNGNFVLRKSDKIYITASHKNMAMFMKLAGIYNQRLRTVMIIGGGRISYYLSRYLLEAGMKVKIIEVDHAKCEELSEHIPNAAIICGDGTDQNLLDEEGIESVDSLVSLTGIDEENIVISMYARLKKVDKVITKVNRISFAQMLDSTGIESIVTPKDIIANVILGYVRSMGNVGGSTEIRSLYRIVNNQAEAVEFKVTKQSELTQNTLKDMKFKKNILLAAIVKGNQIIIPDGNSRVEVGDVVVVVTTEHLNSLAEILE